MAPVDAKLMAKELKTIVESAEPFEGLENVVMHKNGRRIVLEKSGAPFFDSSGNLQGYRGIEGYHRAEKTGRATASGPKDGGRRPACRRNCP